MKRRMTKAEELAVREQTLKLADRYLREHMFGCAADSLRRDGMFWIVEHLRSFTGAALEPEGKQ